MKRIIAMILLFAVVLTSFSGCTVVEDVLGLFYPERPMRLSEELIRKLRGHLDEINALHVDLMGHGPIWIMEMLAKNENRTDKGEGKKDSWQGILVEFDPENYYFACAYFDGEHTHDYLSNCCSDEYEWVGFRRAEYIPEVYNGKQFVAAFQINRTSVCRDILHPLKLVPEIELSQGYMPEFVDGYNVAPPRGGEDEFMYMKDIWKNTIYQVPLSLKEPFIIALVEEKRFVYLAAEGLYAKWTIACAKMKGEYYMKQEICTTDTAGNKQYVPGWEKFGEFTDALKEKWIVWEYSETRADGTVVDYALVRIRDVRKAILDWEG